VTEEGVRRRQFLALGAGLLIVWPLKLPAQQSAKTWRIGFVAHRYEKFYDPLFSGLRELGYVEGQNLIVERRYAEGHAERFQDIAQELVRLNVDAIIVVTTPAAMAARNETKTIPIIHPAAIDPVGTGLIASLAHPGGNVTGLAVLNAETSANVSFHKVAGVEEALRRVGASLRFLPQHSPDLNPIELAFHPAKTCLRKAAERTIEGLHRCVRSFIRTLDPSECRRYFRHAGYDPP
jgi:transposase